MESSYLIVLIILNLLLVIFSALFSASETAYASVSKAKLEENLKTESIVKRSILHKFYNFSQTFTVILICNNIVNIGLSIVLSTLLGAFITYESLRLIVSILVTTPIIVLFGELFPKLIARKHPIKFLRFSWIIIAVFYYLFYPITFVLAKIFKENAITNTEKELKKIIEQGKHEGVLEKEESDLAIKALDFDSIKTINCFTPIKDVVFVDYNMNLSEILDIFKESRFSRIPVRKKGKFIGILLIKDLFFLKDFQIDDYIIQVPFLSANDLLKNNYEKLKKSKSQFGFIKKTKKSENIIGIITLEDILETLVGPIYDEYDFRDGLEYYQISEDSIIVNNRTKITTINEQLEVNLESSFNTIDLWLEHHSKQKLIKSLKFKYEQNELNYDLYFKILDKSHNVLEIQITKKMKENDG
ncbi:hemolysin family protein [Mycoplasma sp. 1654_15]|uniref:hemolysin family protein n=1 Tax=Mycoplasma sp. 1654_15 TaxID=2725994 RepID=UPI0014491C68|nr:hemolysin family protein [Mycoplasma sp. 1654_15]QJB71364.1 HlyC/CorC family transporter [Mycoplasma sp. 1654_15]